MRAMAKDGLCKTFDARADGFARGEGCGVVALKRLRDAITAGDTISGLLVGSATNNDGRSQGWSAPNGLAQQDVIQSALRSAQLAPADVSILEAHGTGTALGDPIEADALATVFAERGAARRTIALGSAKTSLGHLEGAAGIAGLIRAVLILERGEVPPHPTLR